MKRLEKLNKRVLINFRKRLLNRKIIYTVVFVDSDQSYKSGRGFCVGLGPKVDKSFGLNLGLRRTFCRWSIKLELK